MVGVAGPLLRRRPTDGARFLVGLTTGSVAAGLLVSLVVYLLGRAAQLALPQEPRLLLLAAICLAFGLADMIDRTPHIWRQVPQSLIRRLPPGSRGVAWGVDLGLLVTTQKAASLVWATLAAVMLLNPSAAPGLLIGMAMVSCLSVAFWSVRFTPFTFDHGSKRDRLWLRSIRIGSGTVLLTMAGVTAASVPF